MADKNATGGANYQYIISTLRQIDWEEHRTLAF